MAKVKLNLGDLPKFTGEDPKKFPSLHLVEFEDCLDSVGLGWRDKAEGDDAEQIVVKFKNSLKGNARRWYKSFHQDKTAMTIKEWMTIKTEFLKTFSPTGGTKEEQHKTWKDLKWNPEKETIDNFTYKFNELADELNKSVDERYDAFRSCLPSGTYLIMSECEKINDIVLKLKTCIAFGVPGISLKPDTTKTEATTPVVPFMAMKEGKNVSFRETDLTDVTDKLEDDILDIKRSHEKMYTVMDKLSTQFDKIRFENNRNNDRDRDRRDRSRSWDRNRDRNNRYSRDRSQSPRDRGRDSRRDRSWDRNRNSRNGSWDRSRNWNRDRSWSRDRDRNNDRSNDRGRDRGRRDDRNRDRSRDRSNSRDRGRRSGSGVRYGKVICDYCGKTGHILNSCWELRARLEKRNLKLVKNGDKLDKEETEVKSTDMYGKMKTVK